MNGSAITSQNLFVVFCYISAGANEQEKYRTDCISSLVRHESHFVFFIDNRIWMIIFQICYKHRHSKKTALFLFIDIYTELSFNRRLVEHT